MMRHTLMIALAAAVTGCGMGTEGDPAATGASAQDALLYRDQLPKTQLTDLALERTQRCYEQVVAPQLQATIHELVQQRIREVMTDVGPVVQSSYLNTTGDNEEIRKGIAEFQVPQDVQKAVLRFKEARTVWPYPVPADTHGISVYTADFKATIDDFSDPAVEVARFETSVNSPPRDNVNSDVTAAVQRFAPNVGFRFALEATPGSGTEFDNLELVLTRCHNTVQER